MEWIAKNVESVKSMKIRNTLSQFITLGVIVSSALIIWKALMCLTGSESPVVVVLSGSMEPGFKRVKNPMFGDILFLHMRKAPIRTGEIVVYNVDGRDIPIVHRVIEVHEQENNGKVDILTKGDANPTDDRGLYAYGQRWLKPQQIMGRAVGFLPYVGWATIIMTEKPIIKYILVGALGIIVSTALIIWKVLMCLTGSESPVVVVLSGSMEPGFKRGDILFLHMGKAPIRTGEIVVYNVEGRPIPIVHRVTEVHKEDNNGNVDLLTKGDANDANDRGLYANGQRWLKPQQIMGRAVAFVPYAVHTYRRFRSAGHNLEGLGNQVDTI
ncbi:unnamed protein product [Dovyalis caffra]|uniref:signal peptidase I n=1 Tax=Dovyalis caffra TaxID=77055 RepID=A0AAV1SPX6_9ROSI|nr:unnamed protein product [Dovyalis caffra]